MSEQVLQCFQTEIRLDFNWLTWFFSIDTNSFLIASVSFSSPWSLLRSHLGTFLCVVSAPQGRGSQQSQHDDGGQPGRRVRPHADEVPGGDGGCHHGHQVPKHSGGDPHRTPWKGNGDLASESSGAVLCSRSLELNHTPESHMAHCPPRSLSCSATMLEAV